MWKKNIRNFKACPSTVKNIVRPHGNEIPLSSHKLIAGVNEFTKLWSRFNVVSEQDH